MSPGAVAARGDRADLRQFGRFLVVGATGFVVNVGTYALLVRGADLDFRIAVVCGFVASLVNNFHWNRLWTFAARGTGRARRQARRFGAVFALASGCNYGLLQALVRAGGVEKVLAEVIASILVAPLSFAATRRWVFDDTDERAAASR